MSGPAARVVTDPGFICILHIHGMQSDNYDYNHDCTWRPYINFELQSYTINFTVATLFLRLDSV